MLPNFPEDFDLGDCCSCGKQDSTVRNILCLNIAAPIPGTGWGCVLCGLKPDGAIAALCDGCLEHERPIRYIVSGYARKHKRQLLMQNQPWFGHDEALHRRLGYV